MDDPLTVITDLLHDEHGIPVAKLSPAARLGRDLGVDGDDASDLFQRLHERFGTDFSALNEQWPEFFSQRRRVSPGFPFGARVDGSVYCANRVDRDSFRSHDPDSGTSRGGDVLRILALR